MKPLSNRKRLRSVGKRTSVSPWVQEHDLVAAAEVEAAVARQAAAAVVPAK
jgi:hypothetical protein